MYFYRLLSIEELKQKQIHNNQNKFNECENTHKYIKGKSYVHLFLNAESCFEDFERDRYDKCYVAKFNIPDEIVCKYGIGLGGYSPIYNAYSKKYRNINSKDHFWLPEIAIPAEDFDYAWCEDISLAVDKDNRCYLPDCFKTDDLYYREIIYDGYLLGYKNKDELLKKYTSIVTLKKHIIKVLATTKKIIINPKDLNSDSTLAYYVLVNYAKEKGFINTIDEIKLIISETIDFNAICITSSKDHVKTINRQYNYLYPTFCSRLKVLGLDFDETKVMNEFEEQKTKIITL